LGQRSRNNLLIKPCNQLDRRERQFVALYNNKTITSEITTYIKYRSTSSISLSLLISLAVIEGRDIGARGGLQKGCLLWKQLSLAIAKDGILFWYMYRMGLY
jgi:hypothetical protein